MPRHCESAPLHSTPDHDRPLYHSHWEPISDGAWLARANVARVG
jgi:hypothetical protein